MKKTSAAPAGPLFLGIEGGGTKTVALLVNATGRLVAERRGGPGNLRLLSDAALLRLLRALTATWPQPAAVALGFAGARSEADCSRLVRAAGRVWPGVPCQATSDLETALRAAPPATATARVLVLSGTGSCCFGRAEDGRTAKMGGWGHLLGDKGSGYEIGLRALKAAVYYFDRDGKWPRLGQRLLRALALNEPNDLIGWVQTADKAAIAALAVEVFAAWQERDPVATDILEGAAHSLAKDAIHCARQLAAPGTAVQFVLAGGVLLQQPRFARRVARLLRQEWPGAVVTPLRRESAWGAALLAAEQLHPKPVWPVSPPIEPSSNVPRQDLAALPTEQRNPRSRNLDRLPIRTAIELMLNEERRVPAALRKEAPRIERVIRLVVSSLQRGGRLFYVGAGTSGRLGVLDASECPPTFRTDPEQVQGIMAGGQRALWEAVEGAEDDPEAGARAVAFRGVNRLDTVIGIAASGRTPFVHGALGEARRRGARTVLLCFNPSLRLPPAERPDVIVAPAIGPEVLTGSTRLKAGTATKLILNMITTLSMVRLGKVVGNLMVDVKASNEKLRDRAVRIVRELTGAEYTAARAALVRRDWKIKEACRDLGRRH